MFKKGFIGAVLLSLVIVSVGVAEQGFKAEPIPGDALAVRSLRITEIMASNKTTLEDAFGRYPDWIEIYNSTDEVISLKGVFVSDDKDELERYAFADDAVIGPHEYIIVYASGAKKDIADECHTSFKLSAAGESVFISHDSVLIDAVNFGLQQPDISLALDGEEYKLTLTPTPGAANEITPIKD